jgi:hypothetical protein
MFCWRIWRGGKCRGSSIRFEVRAMESFPSDGAASMDARVVNSTHKNQRRVGTVWLT